MRRGLAIILFIFITTIDSRGQDPGNPGRFEFSHGQMGTIFRVICYSDNEELVHSTVKKAFSLIDSLNRIFSDYLPGSELNRLCDHAGSGEFIPVSEPLFDVIEQSIYWSGKSRGIFDITVGPYSQLWRRAIRQEKLPDKAKMMEASREVGYRNIRLDKKHRRIMLTVPGMQLDLGGIAKGYTVDKVAQLLKESDIPVCLIDGGGDIYAGEAPPGEPGWKISFEKHEGIKKDVLIRSRSIATSGDLYRYFEFNGVRYSHIIDPATGLGITVPRTVTVIAPNTTESDVLATILSISGPASGKKIIKKFRGTEALIIQNEGDTQKRYILKGFGFLK